MELRPIDRNQPIVDDKFKALQNLHIFCTQVRNLLLDLYNGAPSGSFSLDDGSASADGSFIFDDGGA